MGKRRELLAAYRQAERAFYRALKARQEAQANPAEGAIVCANLMNEEVQAREVCGRAQVAYENATA